MKLSSAIELDPRHLPPFREGDFAVAFRRPWKGSTELSPVLLRARASRRPEGYLLWERSTSAKLDVYVAAIGGYARALDVYESKLGELRVDDDDPFGRLYMAGADRIAREIGMRVVTCAWTGHAKVIWSRKVSWLWTARSAEAYYFITWHASGDLLLRISHRGRPGLRFMSVGHRCKSLDEAMAFLPQRELDLALQALAKPAVARSA